MNHQSVRLNLNEFLAPQRVTVCQTQDPDTVTGIVCQALSQTSHAEPVLIASQTRDLPAHSMLGILTYCYAKGVYGSGKIAKELSDTPGVRHAPEARAIRRFRILNRDRVQAVLEKALRLIRRARLAETVSRTLPGSAAPAADAALGYCAPALCGEDTTILVRGEAEEILGTATAVDAMLD